MLARCLAALVDRADEKPDQVIVVNGGDERADEVVENYRQKAASRRESVEIKLVKTVNKNLAASRNVGLPHCKGDIVAMTDDDAEVYPDWVTKMKRAHAEHPEAGAVGGTVIGADSRSLLGRVADQVTFVSYPTPRYVRTLPGVNVSYKRLVVERVGLQDETLFRGEDVDFNWRVKQLGCQVYFDPSVRVLHHHRPTLRAFLRQHYMYGRAYYLVRRKWPAMYCVYPHHISSLKDILKLFYPAFLVMSFPFRASRGFSARADRLGAFGVIMLIQASWTVGVYTQALRFFLGGPK